MAYFLFLIPVISISNIGAHYLYFSSIPMSIAFALLINKSILNKVYSIFSVLIFLLLILFLHQLFIQKALYNDGKCQKAFLENIDALMTRYSHSAKEIYITPEFGAPMHVAIRTLFSRDDYLGLKNFPKIIFINQNLDLNPYKDKIIYKMDENCRLSNE